MRSCHGPVGAVETPHGLLQAGHTITAAIQSRGSGAGITMKSGFWPRVTTD